MLWLRLFLNQWHQTLTQMYEYVVHFTALILKFTTSPKMLSARNAINDVKLLGSRKQLHELHVSNRKLLGVLYVDWQAQDIFKICRYICRKVSLFFSILLIVYKYPTNLNAQ